MSTLAPFKGWYTNAAGYTWKDWPRRGWPGRSPYSTTLPVFTTQKR
ncbi:hypothetical protein [Vreelandella lionensis]